MAAPVCTYVLPIRRAAFAAAEADELAEYLEFLAGAGCEVLVVDGSPAEVFERHREAWGNWVRHEAVDRRFGYRNDKVNGIHTGVERATGAKIVLADDDIRYDAASLGTIVALLDRAEVVRPQNFLAPLPWWGAMEAARMLINRATLATGDYPGTCAFRRGTFLAAGRYDGDVLFDNEEIMRHFAQSGATIVYALDLLVRKRPPVLRKWLEQRPRQAYEDFSLRAKTALFFALPPVGLGVAAGFGAAGFGIFCGGAALLATAVALRGWSRGKARGFFPLRVIFFAPLWVLERSLSTYWALYWFVVHGGYPFGGELLSRGIGRAWRPGGQIAARAARRQVVS